MQRVGFILKVKEDMIEDYKKHHREVWPELLDALREAGWRNYSIFMREDGLLFGYTETDDFEKSLAAMAGKEVNKRWQEFMAPYFENLGGKHADESMVPLEQVFFLE